MREGARAPTHREPATLADTPLNSSATGPACPAPAPLGAIPAEAGCGPGPRFCSAMIKRVSAMQMAARPPPMIVTL